MWYGEPKTMPNTSLTYLAWCLARTIQNRATNGAKHDIYVWHGVWHGKPKPCQKSVKHVIHLFGTVLGTEGPKPLQKPCQTSYISLARQTQNRAKIFFLYDYITQYLP